MLGRLECFHRLFAGIYQLLHHLLHIRHGKGYDGRGYGKNLGDRRQAGHHAHGFQRAEYPGKIAFHPEGGRVAHQERIIFGAHILGFLGLELMIVRQAVAGPGIDLVIEYLPDLTRQRAAGKQHIRLELAVII